MKLEFEGWLREKKKLRRWKIQENVKWVLVMKEFGGGVCLWILIEFGDKVVGLVEEKP